MRQLTHGSLFTGILGFERGFEAAGFETLWCSEVDKFCNKVIAKRAPGVPNLGDVATIQRPAAVDVLTFGSPCQDLSVAGRRAGLGGARSSLFFEAARVINQCRPAFAVWENVPGAFSSDLGRDFWMVLYTLRELGAHDVAWRVFDSQYAGVPQQRTRIYLVADFRGRRAGEILFEPEGCSGHPSPFEPTWQDLAGTVAGGAYGTGRRTEDDPNLIHAQLVARALTSHPDRQDATVDTYVIQDARAGVEAKGQNGVGARRSDTAYTLDTLATQAVAITGQRMSALTSEGADASEDGSGRGTPMAFQTRFARNGRGAPREVAPDLQAQSGEDGRGDGANWLHRGSTIRRFTPVECERLQGFPPGWTCLCGAECDIWSCKCADGPRYRALGNAVTTTVPAWIAPRMAALL